MKTQILMTTSIVVEVDSSEDRTSPQMQAVSRQLTTAVKRAFVGVPEVGVLGTVSYDWLEEEDVNSGRCCRCDAWVTDRNSPNALSGLSDATVQEDGLVCDQCRVWGTGPESVHCIFAGHSIAGGVTLAGKQT